MFSRLKLLLLAIALGMAAVVAGLARPAPDPPAPPSFLARAQAALPIGPPPLPTPPPPPPPSSVVDGPVLALPLPQQRAHWHRMLQQGLRVHDSCLYLLEVGDESSVPFLIHALHLVPITPDGGVVCTRSHCLEALKAITHKDLGLSTHAWEHWWSRTTASARPGPA